MSAGLLRHVELRLDARAGLGPAPEDQGELELAGSTPGLCQPDPQGRVLQECSWLGLDFWTVFPRRCVRVCPFLALVLLPRSSACHLRRHGQISSLGLTKIKQKNTVGIYNTANGEHIVHLEAVDGCLIRCTRWSPDSAVVAIGTSVVVDSGGAAGTAFIKFFFIRNLELGGRCEDDVMPADPDTGAGARRARMIHSQNNMVADESCTLSTRHTADIVEIAFGPTPETNSDKHRVATGGKDNKVMVFFYNLCQDGISNWHLVYECDDFLNRVYTISWKPDGNHIVVGSDDHTIRIYDVRDAVRAAMCGRVATCRCAVTAGNRRGWAVAAMIAVTASADCARCDLMCCSRSTSTATTRQSRSRSAAARRC